jgi:predicted Zn-dependent peptidase
MTAIKTLKNHKLHLFLIFNLLAIWSSLAQNKVKESKNLIPLDSTVRHGQLKNGFTYYLKENNFPANTIEFYLVNKAGRMHEDEDQLEYAHLLEHLLAQETKSFKNPRKHFNDLGGVKGAQTGTHFTFYNLSVPSKKSQNLKDGLQILREWSQGQSWSPEAASVQRAAVLGEMRSNDPYQKWRSHTLEMKILANKGYKIPPSEKYKENIEHFNPKALERFYKDWYRPDLQAAVIVGDINLDSVEYDIKRLFSDLKITENPKNEQVYLDKSIVKFNGKNRFSIVTDSLRPGLKIEIVRSRPNFSLSPQTIEDYRMMLLQQLYDIILTKRSISLENQYKPPFDKFDPNYRSNRLAGNQINATVIGVDIDNVNTEKIKNHFKEAIIAYKRMHLDFQDKELQEAKLELKDRYQTKELNDSKSLANKFKDHFIYSKAAPSSKEENILVSKILNKIDLSDIQDYSQKFANLKKDTNFIFFKGEKETIPELQLFKEWIEELNAMSVEPLKPPSPPITSLAEVANIPRVDISEELSVKQNAIGISSVLLPNNIKLVLKPTDPQSDYFKNTVELLGFRDNPATLENRRKYLAATAVPQVLEYSGVGPYTKFEINRYLKEKGMQLRLRNNVKNQFISGKAKINDLPEILNLLYLYLKQPRQDIEAFEAYKINQFDELRGKAVRGSSEFIMDKVMTTWYPKIPVFDMNELETLRMNEVFEAANQYFSDLSGFTFIITGDFNSDELLPVLANTLVAFPTRDQDTQREYKLDYPLKKMDKKVYFKNTNQVYTKLYFPVKIPEGTKTQVELQLLSKALNQRIFARLRDGCYAPYARGMWMDRSKDIYAFEITFNSELGDEHRMLANAKEEFTKLRDKGVDKEWLEKAIVNELRIYENRFDRFAYFNFWPDYLQQKLENSINLEKEVLEYGTLLEHFISLEDINIAAKEFMKVENLQLFQGYPEGYQDVK